MTDEILFQTAQRLGHFPKLLSEQIPFKLIDLAQKKLNCDELNILNVSDGWAGCLVSTVAWAHQHPEISVNLINCDPNPQIIESMSRMEDFLKNALYLPNFKFNQVTGSLADFQAFKKVQDLSGSQGRIFIGSITNVIDPSSINISRTYQSPSPGHNYSDWCLEHLEPAICKSSLYLKNSSSPSVAFWNIYKKFGDSKSDALSKSADIWAACGLRALATIFIDQGQSNSTGDKGSNHCILVEGNQMEGSFQEIATKDTAAEMSDDIIDSTLSDRRAAMTLAGLFNTSKELVQKPAENKSNTTPNEILKKKSDQRPQKPTEDDLF